MSVYGFGPFVLDVAERRLTRQGQRIAVVGKTFEVLRLLAEAEGRLVERETFNARLWPDVTVEERNLTVQISALRKALADGSGSIDVIETVARAGYRLALPVRRLGPPERPAERPANDGAPTALQLIKAEARANLHKIERLPAFKALSLFERGLEIDPNDAECHAGMASTYLQMASTTIRRPMQVVEVMALTRAAAQRALVLDENNGEARAALGRLKMTYEWDWAGAESELRRAVAADPASADAALTLGQLLGVLGRHDEGNETLTRARRLDPLRRDIVEHHALGCWMVGQGERALAVLADAVNIEPAHRRPHFRRMFILDQLGRHDEAMAERITWLELCELGPFAVQLADLVRRRGHRDGIVEFIGLLEYQNQWYEAAIHRMAVGDGTKAIEALEHSVTQRVDVVIFCNQAPSFRPLRSHARFQQLVRHLGLAEATAGEQRSA